MIVRKKLYERREPDKDATLFLILCEGSYREPEYFKYFSGLSSRIQIVPIPSNSQGDNSPVGLYNDACKLTIITETNPLPDFIIGDNDQLWFVIDTDQWKEKIDYLKERLDSHKNWFIAQSNPCFEVWLFFHFYSDFPDETWVNDSTEWKQKLGQLINGGFDLRKRPILIQTAVENAKEHENNEEKIKPPFSHVYKLIEQFYPLVKETINKAITES